MNVLQKCLGIVALGACLAGAAMSPSSAQSLTGAGSTFVNPIMTQWIAQYDRANHTTVNYQAIGSGGGINALVNHTVDFAGSDVPMNAGELGEAKAPVYHVPDIVGAVVIAYNIPNIGPAIQLTGPVLADIYLGKITRWNDPRIAKLSPGVKFPDAAIFVAHRSDGSGTTAIFTDYLSKISSAWQSGPGTGKSINWPVGLGGKGNPGVAGLLKDHADSIGYIELAYAVQNDIPYAKIQNAKGKFIYPTAASAAAAAQSVPLSPMLTASLTDSPSRAGYPITGYSYLIVYRSPAARGGDLKKFLTFVVTQGQSPAYTKPGFYARIPQSVASKVLAEIDAIH